MPQIVLEITRNVEPVPHADLLLGGIHALVAGGGGRLENCKSRLRRLDEYRVGGGDSQRGFVHLEIRLLEGRSQERKQSLGEAALAFLVAQFTGALRGMDLQITVEVGDLPRALYFKHPSGTLGGP